MNESIFNAIAQAAISSEMALAAAKEIRFPRHSVVAVDCLRYRGLGIVVLEDGTPTVQLAVKIENDNLWRYPVTACTPVASRKEWPKWIKRKLARWKRLEKPNSVESFCGILAHAASKT